MEENTSSKNLWSEIIDKDKHLSKEEASFKRLDIDMANAKALEKTPNEDLTNF